MAIDSTTQYLTLQNTDTAKPIQIKISQDTDYWALGVTLFITIFVSAITAWVTIKLVSNTNRELVKGQEKQVALQLENQEKQQKNDVRSRNRQEWINKVRDLIAEYLNSSWEISLKTMECANKYIRLRQNRLKYDDFLAAAKDLTLLITFISQKSVLIDLILSKDNALDREISSLTNSILIEYSNLNFKVFNEIDKKFDTLNSDQINLYTYAVWKNEFNEINNMHKINSEITIKTKELLKQEWERVKNFD